MVQSFAPKPFYPKAFIVTREKMTFSCEVKPARFQYMNDYKGGYITPKNGYILLKWCEIIDGSFDWKG